MLLCASFLISDAEYFHLFIIHLDFFSVNYGFPQTVTSTVLWAGPVRQTLISSLAFETNHSIRKRRVFFFWQGAMIALQCCVSLCWTMKWISCVYTYISSLVDLPFLTANFLGTWVVQNPKTPNNVLLSFWSVHHHLPANVASSHLLEVSEVAGWILEMSFQGEWVRAANSKGSTELWKFSGHC